MRCFPLKTLTFSALQSLRPQDRNAATENFSPPACQGDHPLRALRQRPASSNEPRRNETAVSGGAAYIQRLIAVFPVLHSVVDCEWDQPLRISKILSQVSVTHHWTRSQTDRSRSFRIILPRCFSIVLILRFNSEAITLLGNPPVTIRPPCRAAKTDIVKSRKTQPHSENALLRNLFTGLLTATGRIL